MSNIYVVHAAANWVPMLELTGDANFALHQLLSRYIGHLYDPLKLK